MRIHEAMIQRFPPNWEVQVNAEKIVVRDSLLEKGQGYRIDIEQTLAGYRATMQFEDYAVKLIHYAEEKIESEFLPIASLFKGKRNLSLRLFRRSVQRVFFEVAPEADGWWIELELRNEDRGFSVELFLDALVAVVIFLVPYYVEGEQEGERVSSLTTKVERSLLNRSICLAFHGYNCKACGVSLQEKYGDVAWQFIHVHHLYPIAERGVNDPDPIRDMVPLCPNCHEVAHLRLPPYTVQEITEMINQNNKNANGSLRI